MDSLIVPLVFFVTLQPLYVHGEGNYECGEHGRFEYCIDGIPGCVVGCYCHPGYYFDTDTKICEHNSKITARVKGAPQEPLITRPSPSPPPLPTTSEPAEIPPSPQSSDSLIEKLESMDKSATDDLSDWLYNQFFKTVESQVINKTDDGSTPSRRSGGGSIIKHIKKKGRRKGKKKSRKKDSRRKLLRITENDSVFDSSSSGSSSSDSDSCSGSSSSSSEDSKESDDDKEYKNHKKLIMYQKRPKVPLPSFIFLPNAGETPYFPPIGLPPPPPMPMYPMVPVPPMVLMVPGKNKTATTQATTTMRQTVKSEKPNDDTTTVSTTANTTTAGARRKKIFRKTPTNLLREARLPTDKGMLENENMFNNVDFSPAQQYKFLQKLRDRKKMNMNNKQFNSRKGNMNKKLLHVSGRRTYAYNPLEEIGQLDNNQQDFEDIPSETQEIDFKYITELIHNKSNTVPSQNGKEGQNINVGDGYYSALGKEIAGLVRKTAIGVDQTVAGQSPLESDQLQYFENSYSPRSYWERSVRSPYFYDQLEKLDWPKKMNQKLFDLEDKVRLAVTAKPTLKLEELEDAISAMGKKQILNQKRIFENEESNLNNNLKVSLLPADLSITDIKMINENIKNIDSIPYSNNYIIGPKEMEISNYILSRNQEDNSIIWDTQMIKNVTQITQQNKKGHKSLRFKETNYPIHYSRPKSRMFPHEINRKGNNSYAATTRNLKLPYLRSPIILNRKNMKFSPKVRETHFKNFYSPYYQSSQNLVKTKISPFSLFS